MSSYGWCHFLRVLTLRSKPREPNETVDSRVKCFQTYPRANHQYPSPHPPRCPSNTNYPNPSLTRDPPLTTIVSHLRYLTIRRRSVFRAVCPPVSLSPTQRSFRIYLHHKLPVWYSTILFLDAATSRNSFILTAPCRCGRTQIETPTLTTLFMMIF